MNGTNVTASIQTFEDWLWERPVLFRALVFLCATLLQMWFVFFASGLQESIYQLGSLFHVLSERGSLLVSFLFYIGLWLGLSAVALTVLSYNADFYWRRSPTSNRPIIILACAVGVSIAAGMIGVQLNRDFPGRFQISASAITLITLTCFMIGAVVAWATEIVARATAPDADTSNRSIELITPWLLIALVCFLGFKVAVPDSDDEIRSRVRQLFIGSAEKSTVQHADVVGLQAALDLVRKENLEINQDDLAKMACAQVETDTCAVRCLMAFQRLAPGLVSTYSVETAMRKYIERKRVLGESVETQCTPFSATTVNFIQKAGYLALQVR